MELQKSILLFFSGLHLGFLDKIAEAITVFGEEMLVIAILVFIYWNVNKKKGAASVMVLLAGTNLMGIIKAIVRFPWLVIPGLDTQRIDTATGYSFPSGHTTTAASAYSSIAFSFRKKALSIICAVMILLVGISRCYLCCHWPLDVICGWMLGIGCCLILYPRITKLLENRDKYCKVFIPAGIIFSLTAAIMGILVSFEKINSLAFSDLSKSIAIAGGLLIGWCIETCYCDFKIEDAFWGRKILRYAIGMAVVVIILPVSKSLLNKLGIYNPFLAQLRYFLVAIWAALYPMLGVKLKLFVK